MDISGDMINVEDDDDDMEIPCSQIVCQSPYARMKYVEPNNNNVEHNWNTEDGQKNIVEKKDLEQVTDNICKKEENKKQEVDTTGNNVEPSSTEQKGSDKVKNDIHKKEENKYQAVDTTHKIVDPSSTEQKGIDEVKDEMCICKTEETKTKTVDVEHKDESEKVGQDEMTAPYKGNDTKEEEENQDKFDSEGTEDATGEGTGVEETVARYW